MQYPVQPEPDSKARQTQKTYMDSSPPPTAPYADSPQADSYGRLISYLRLSVTDRCNLACAYCSGKDSPHSLPHAEILSYEEMLEVIGAALELGIKKVRLTGGEPFCRKGFIDFVRRVRASYPDLRLGLTSNGTLLRPYLKDLRALGVTDPNVSSGVSLNISLDSFDRERFCRITGRDALPEVLSAIHEALALGLPLKINAVGLKGVNDADLPAFVEFARTHPVDVRFIEYMPIGPPNSGAGNAWSAENFWPAAAILEAAGKTAALEPIIGEDNWLKYSGPARLYQIKGGLGRFGVITPITQHFCGNCNRMRLTADGRFKPCLFSDDEYNIKEALRAAPDAEAGRAAVKALFARAVAAKPMGDELLRARQGNMPLGKRAMSAIGG